MDLKTRNDINPSKTSNTMVGNQSINEDSEDDYEEESESATENQNNHGFEGQKKKKRKRKAKSTIRPSY